MSRLVHPISLRFADRRLEPAYKARAFSEGETLFAGLCIGFLGLLALVCLAAPALQPQAISAAASILVAMWFRRHVVQLDDESLERTVFSWAMCFIAIVRAGCYSALREQIEAAQGGPVPSSSRMERACGCLVLCIFSLLQRHLCFSTVPRLATLLVASLITGDGGGPLIRLASPDEGAYDGERLALIACALLVGELLGHPVELLRRVAYAREAATRLPDPASDAASLNSIAISRLVHPLSLRFAKRSLEEAYADRAFGEAQPLVVGFGVGLTALVGTYHAFVPLPQNVGSVISLAVMTGARLGLRRLADQARARVAFSWIWCAIVVARNVGLAVPGRRGGVMSVAASVSGCFLWFLFALFQKVCIHDHAPRLLGLVSVAVGSRVSSSPNPAIGDVQQSALVVAALLTGETFGHPVELERRARYARHVASTPTGLPDPTADAAVAQLRLLTLRFADGRLERAFAEHAFGGQCGLAIAGCFGLIGCTILQAVSLPYLLPRAEINAVLLLAVMWLRLNLHQLADQALARDGFAWGCCAVVALRAAIFAAYPRHVALPVTSPRALALERAIVAAPWFGISLVQRVLSFPPLPRMVSYAIVVFSMFALVDARGEAAAGTPASRELTSSTEAALLVAPLLLGELLGHPFEIARRNAFAQQHAQTALAKAK